MHCPTCNKKYEAGAFCASDGTALVEDAAKGMIGQVVAERYRIERLIGEGGMGQVYQARHLNINKRFAIKLLKPEVVGSALSVQRFRQEAWAASSIGNEHIVEIDDFATLPDGSVYLAMEFLEGLTVAERLRDGPPISLEEGVAVMLSVCRGLGAAHEKGIIHRDMKPENVFLARRNNRQVAKILDFGIAKMSGADEPSNLTRTGAIFGTPLYMSPEQARGKRADARSDVYSVGVILYELATASVPFGGESAVEILNQHIAAAPISPSLLAPERAIPPALEALILRALAKDPEARFQSMAELIVELEAVAALLPPFSSSLSGVNARIGGGGAVMPTPPPLVTPAAALLVKTPAADAAATSVSGSGPVIARPSSVMRVAQAVATPAQREASGAMRLSQPPADTASTAAAQGARTTVDAAPLTIAPADTRGGSARSRALIVGAVALLAAGGVSAWYALSRRAEPAQTTAQNTTAQNTTAQNETAQNATAQNTTAQNTTAQNTTAQNAVKTDETKAVKGAREVLVDTVPTGAKILRDGKVVAETPEAMQLTARTPIVLQKEGFVDKALVLDADETRKLLVKLERAKTPAAKIDPKTAKTIAKSDPKADRRGNDPYEMLPPTPTHTKKGKDELIDRVEKRAAIAIPGGKRVGPYYTGTAAGSNGHTDWFIQLDAAKCYTFIGEGGPGVDGLFLFLWGPAGHRLRDARVRTPHAEMIFCTAIPGLYHFQAKSAVGQGEYRVAIYTR